LLPWRAGQGSFSFCIEEFTMNDVHVPHAKLHIMLHRCTEADTEAVSNWCDVFLAGDYFVRKGHMLNLIRNPVVRVCAVIIDEVIAGFVAVYKDTTLQNLILDPQYRGQGVGSALIAVLKPTVVRCKSNMLAGDPTGFYEQNGYVTVAKDVGRPHISVMTNDPAMVPKLTEQEAKQQKNRERMKELRAIQAQKRAQSQADAVQAILTARGVASPPQQPSTPPPTPTAAPKPGNTNTVIPEGVGSQAPGAAAGAPHQGNEWLWD
jgi:GNAT superfamily N-acetyltransferase